MADTSKTATVADWPIPNTIKELQQFLGLSNYYHRFIKNFAAMAAPHTSLLQSKVVQRWGPTQQESFKKLKEALFNPPVLQLPSFQYDFAVEIDASKVALGSSLMEDIR